MLRKRSYLYEEEITHEWVKGVRAWWKQWLKKANSFLKKKDKYTKDELNELYYVLVDGKERLARIRDNLLYVQGFWPYGAKGKKTLDPKQKMMSTAAIITKGGEEELSVLEVKNFPAKLLYKIKDAINYILPRTTLRNITHADIKQMTSEYVYLGILRWISKDLRKADRIMGKEIFDKLDNIVDVLLDPMRKAKEQKVIGVSIGYGQMTGVKEFSENIPEFKVGNMLVRLDIEPVSADPIYAFKKKGEQLSPKVTKRYLKPIINAKSILDKGGFGYLWYGEIIIHGEAHSKITVPGWESSKTSKMTAGASYARKGDSIEIYHFINSDVELKRTVFTILHELGHRLWYKFLTPDQRNQWISRYGEVEFQRSYSKKNPMEEFSDTFVGYLSESLKPDQLQRFRSVVLQPGMSKKRTEEKRLRRREYLYA